MQSIIPTSLVELNLDPNIHDISESFHIDTTSEVIDLINPDLYEGIGLIKIKSPSKASKFIKSQLGIENPKSSSCYLLKSDGVLPPLTHNKGKCIGIALYGWGEVCSQDSEGLVRLRVNENVFFTIDLNNPLMVFSEEASEILFVSVTDAEWQYLHEKFMQFNGGIPPVLCFKNRSCNNPASAPVVHRMTDYHFNATMLKLKEESSLKFNFEDDMNVFQNMISAHETFVYQMSLMAPHISFEDMEGQAPMSLYKTTACVPCVNNFVGIHSDPHGNCVCTCLEGEGNLYVLHANELVTIRYTKGDLVQFDDRDPHFVITAKPSAFLVANIPNDAVLN